MNLYKNDIEKNRNYLCNPILIHIYLIFKKYLFLNVSEIFSSQIMKNSLWPYYVYFFQFLTELLLNFGFILACFLTIKIYIAQFTQQINLHSKVNTIFAISCFFIIYDKIVSF